MIVDNYILGNETLHNYFHSMIDILGKLVSCAPRPVSITQLEHRTGRSAAELLNFCRSLWRATLIRPCEGLPDTWELACAPSAVTLEDVFRCAIAEQVPHGKQNINPPDDDRMHYQLDLLLMQATMSINQSVFNHLRQFSLDRLHIGTAGMSQLAAYSRRSARYAMQLTSPPSFFPDHQPKLCQLAGNANDDCH